MEIREFGDEEFERSFYLGTQAFGGGGRDSSHWNDPNRPDANRYGVYDDSGVMQARVVIIQFEVHMGPDSVVPMGGVAGVACLPDQRGKGYAGDALRYSLEKMREKGQALSSLFPFSWAFYHSLGWAWVGEDREYIVKASTLPKPDPETENVREASADDRAKVQDIYTRFAGRYRGMLRRDEKHWNRVLNHGKEKFTYTYLYEKDGSPEGYLTLSGWKEKKTRIREFLALTPRARRALLGLLRRMDMQVEKFAWNAPADDPFWSHTYNWEIKTETGPKCMGRVVDVKPALESLRPAHDVTGAITFAVQDKHAPWNTGTWRAELEGGRVMVARTDAAPQVSLDIQTLSQLVWGTPDADHLLRAGLLDMPDGTAYETLRALTSGPPMWMNDDF